MVFFHLWFDMLAFSWLVAHLRISVLWPRNWHFRHSIFLILRLCGCIFFVVSIHHFSLLPSQIMNSASVSVFNLVTPLLLVSSELEMHASLGLPITVYSPVASLLTILGTSIRWIPDPQDQLSTHLHCFFCFLTLCLTLKKVLDHPADCSLSGLSVLCLFEIRTEFICFPKLLVGFTVVILISSSLHEGWLIQIVKFSTSYTNFYLHIPIFIFHAFVS